MAVVGIGVSNGRLIRLLLAAGMQTVACMIKLRGRRFGPLG